jgi:hypothetical protein
MGGSGGHNLHFWVGAMFAGVGLAMVVMLGDEKLGTGLQGLIVAAVILGTVLMVRYPLRRKRPY